MRKFWIVIVLLIWCNQRDIDSAYAVARKVHPANYERMVSNEGVALILRYEKWKETAYDDGYGNWTVGIGLTTLNGKPVRQGMSLTSEEVWVSFCEEVERVEAEVRNAVKVPLEGHEVAALVSFAFNVGMGNFNRSTLLKRLNDGKKTQAAAEFAKWCYVKNRNGEKVRSNGLYRRRLDEAKLFQNLPI